MLERLETEGSGTFRSVNCIQVDGEGVGLDSWCVQRWRSDVAGAWEGDWKHNHMLWGLLNPLNWGKNYFAFPSFCLGLIKQAYKPSPISLFTGCISWELFEKSFSSLETVGLNPMQCFIFLLQHPRKKMYKIYKKVVVFVHFLWQEPAAVWHREKEVQYFSHILFSCTCWLKH